jgi:protocatechuate 3,4-dioxygenase beta subunit
MAAELSGRVLVDGKPVAGITVAAVPAETTFAAARREARGQEAGPPLAIAVTNAGGGYTLAFPDTAEVPPFGIRLSGGGVAGVLVRAIFERAIDAELEDLTAQRAESLSGRVVDARGRPVNGATVTLWNGSSGSSGPAGEYEPVPAIVRTRPDGSFELGSATENGNRLRIEAPGVAITELRLLPSGARQQPIVPPASRAVTGVVLESDGRTAAAGVLVRFEGTATSRWVEAAADGSFTLDGLPREGGTLVANGGERGACSSPAPAHGDVVLALAPAGTIRGRVVDADTAAPIARVQVMARRATDAAWARSSEEGGFEIRGLGAQAYALSVDDPGYLRWGRERVSVQAGQSVVVDVALSRAAGLSGRVIDEDGRGIAGALGSIQRGGEPAERSMMMWGRSAFEGFVTRRDGTFNATQLVPGANRQVDFSHDDYEQRTIHGITLTAGGTRPGLTVVLPRALALRGTVRDERGMPLPDVAMALSQLGPGEGQSYYLGRRDQQTTSEGGFEFRGLWRGDYSLSARRRGYVRETIEQVTVAAGANEPLEIVLEQGVTISGFVKDKAGKGAAGHRVTAERLDARLVHGESLGSLYTEELTGADGAFVLDGASPGVVYKLDVSGGVDPDSGSLNPRITAPAQGVEIRVRRKGRIRGVVSDVDGRPIPGFEVYYAPPGTGGGPRFSAGPCAGGACGVGEKMPVREDDGRFEIDDVPAGTWDVEASAPGYQRGRAAGVTVEEGGLTQGVQLRLIRGAVLTGQVLDAQGRPVADARVRTELAAGEASRFSFMFEKADNEASTDAGGRFEIGGLAPAIYRVVAWHPSYCEETTTAEVKGARAGVEIRLRVGATLTGTVFSEGRPVPGARVELGEAGAVFRHSPEGRQSISDDDGRFRFERLSPGRYALSASVGRQASEAVAVALAAADATQDVSLALYEGATIRGRVSGLSDADRAGVLVLASGGASFRTSAQTGPDGTFEVTGAPRGSVWLSAMTNARPTRHADARLTIAEGQNEVTAEIVFETGFRVDGRLTRGGRPVAGASVVAFSDEHSSGGAPAETDENGAFTLEGLREGTYTIHATASWSPGTLARRTARITGNATVDLEVSTARLAGSVADAESGRPLDGVTAEARDQDRPLASEATLTDGGGRFTIEGLDPKPYRLVVRKPGYQTETRHVTASEDADVSFDLRRGDGIAIVARDGILGTPLRAVRASVVDRSGTMLFFAELPLDSDGRGELPPLPAGQYDVRIGAGGYATRTLRRLAVPASTLAVTLTPGGTIEIRLGPELAAMRGAKAQLLSADGEPCSPDAFGPADGTFRIADPVQLLGPVSPGRYTLAVDGGLTRELEVTEGETTVVVLP